MATIFDIEGGAGLCCREAAALDEYSRARLGVVLATGGGAVLAEGNRALSKARGCVVYLRAGVDELYRRVARDRNRPLLHTPDPRQRLTDLIAQRERLYDEVADITLDTADQPVTQVLRALLPLLQARQATL
ncbi:Shikimate kinase OS=Castellaniella defragrans OX=75697 GN=aroK PE=3 SV=1 [Castellaniella defragrans]